MLYDKHAPLNTSIVHVLTIPLISQEITGEYTISLCSRVTSVSITFYYIISTC